MYNLNLTVGNLILKPNYIISATNPIDLKKYLDSEEANKVFRAMEVSNEVNAALFGNLKDYATNPKKVHTAFVFGNLT